MEVSYLRPWARGIVAENKTLNQNDVLVTPIEILFQLDGEISVNSESLSDSGLDADGNNYTVNVQSRAAIRCSWLPLGSNRTTAPDVRRGERVMIYKYADADIYYWKEIGLDDDLRRLETIILRFSDLPDGTSDEELGPDNCYFMSISTHVGMIELVTCKSNKEPFAYKIQLNTHDGIFLLTDDIDNYLQLESGEHIITFENADKTRVELNKEDLFLFARRDGFFEFGRDFGLKVGRNRLTKIQENDTETVGGNQNTTVVKNMTQTVQGNYVNNTTGTYSINSASFSVTAAGGKFTLAGGQTSTTLPFVADNSFQVKGTTTLAGGTTSKILSGPDGHI